MEYALSRTVSIVLLSFIVTAQANSLCQPTNISYNVGEKVPLLDILAAEVTSLDQQCLKEVRIPGAIETRLVVERAEFGSNPIFIYGKSGQERERLFDEINIFKTSCDDIREQRGFAIKTNETDVFNGVKLCLQIIPETSNKNLGIHYNGGRIVVYVIVTLAECRNNDVNCAPVRCKRECQETANGSTCVCSLFPPLKTTQGPTTNGYSLSWTPEVTKAATAAVTTSVLTVTAGPTTGLTTESSSTLPTSPQVASTTASINRQHISMPGTTTAIIYVTSKTTTQKTTTAVKHVTPKTTLQVITAGSYVTPRVSEETTIASNRPFGSTVPITTSLSTSAYSTMASSTITDVTTQNLTDDAAAVNHNSEQEIFGLLEGLYVVGAGIVVLLALTLAVCIVRRRQHRCFHLPLSGTISGSSDGGALAWRENWLVRYHDNKSDRVADYDNDFRLIHGKFHHSSNPELHHIHIDPYTGGDEEDEENAYDNPWPLIRLDSDFMEKTKRLEREMSSTCLSDDSPRFVNENETVNNQEPKQANNTENNIHTDADNSKIGEGEVERTLDKKYSVIRVQRSSSKTNRYSTMPQHKTSTQSNGETSGHETMAVDRKTRQKHTRTSSSFSSQCSADVEDFVKTAVTNIEAAIDTENITGTIDIESSNSVEGTNNPKGWKVSAIYAIVRGNTNDGKSSQNTRSATRRSASTRSNGSPVRGLSYHAIADQNTTKMPGKPHHNATKDQTDQSTLDTKPISSITSKIAKPKDNEMSGSQTGKLTGSQTQQLTRTPEVDQVESRDNHVTSAVVSNSPITEPYRVRRDQASGTVQFRK
ncbi:uncharacterized protein LOC127851182 [Dreissena polymorpha]|nr:uncharacterized protein LOC127851182 [Dreissena polymorpha]